MTTGRKTIVHRFPSNYPFHVKKRKEKKKILLFGTNDRSPIIAFSRAKSNALPASFASRAPSKPWLAEKWRNEQPERKGEKEREREREREGKGETRTCGCVHAREREGKNGEKRWRRYKVRGSGSISGIAILLLAPLLIARPLKIMNVNYA